MMLPITLLLACLAADEPSVPSTSAVNTKPTNPTLRSELLARKDRDQELRKQKIASPDDEQLTAKLKTLDSENTKWMSDQVKQYGWPTISMVGRDGANAAFLLVQHADRDPAFQRKCLDLMTPLAEKEEVAKPDLALLTDRVLLAEGKKQRYGSQFTTDAQGRFAPRPIEDEAHVDERRAEMGLPTLAVYRVLLESVYQPKAAKESAKP